MGNGRNGATGCRQVDANIAIGGGSHTAPRKGCTRMFLPVALIDIGRWHVRGSRTSDVIFMFSSGGLLDRHGIEDLLHSW